MGRPMGYPELGESMGQPERDWSMGCPGRGDLLGDLNEMGLGGNLCYTLS